MEREREGGDWRAHGGGGGARMFVLPALPLAPWDGREGNERNTKLERKQHGACRQLSR